MSLSQFTQKVEKPSIDDRIMPLINIVFLLLIFFLVAGIIREPDPMDITPPESVAEAMRSEDSLNLYIDANGKMAVGQVVIPVADMPGKLQQALAKAPDSSVRIIADRGVETVEIVNLMDMLRDVGVVKVSLTTEAITGTP